MPKINGNEIRPGNVLEHDGGLWAAVKVDHVKPGKAVPLHRLNCAICATVPN